MAELYITLALTIDGDGIVDPYYPNLTFLRTTTIAELKIQLREKFNLRPSCRLKCVSNGAELTDDINLANTGLGNNDHLRVDIVDPSAVSQFAPNAEARIPPNVATLLNADPEALAANFIADPTALQNLLQTNPTLAQAALNNDIFAIQQWQYQERQKWQTKIAQENQRRVQLSANPLDSSAQARIMEEIRQQNVQQNYGTAVEHMPEAFARVAMLYIPVKIEGTPVCAFVDSGAQSTIISKSLAQKCNIFRLIDRRFAGVAQGVGTARILGRIHMASVQFGSLHIPCSFTVMDDKMEFLFGLDMLRRYQACIDLGKNVLRIQDNEVKFLNEAQIEKYKTQKHMPEPMETEPASQPKPPAMPQAEESVPSVPVAPPQPQRSRDDTTEAALAQLTGLGFPRREAEMALEQTGGNVELAASFLYAQAWGS